MPERVRSLSRIFLNEPIFLSLSEDAAPQEIEHFFMVTTAQEKEANLARIIEYENPDSAIIFCNTKDDVRFVTSYLQRRGFDADQISGDLSQAARELAMKRIKAGKLKILVATDVAARGIDISDLSHVIGYSAPQSPEVYIHRTGRTGRAGKAGVAISLVSGLDIGNFRYLQQVNKIKITERELPTEKIISQRLRDSMSVKIEQEVRAIPERERPWKVDRFIPIVEDLVSTAEGKRDLAAICFAFLHEHQPETAVEEPTSKDSGDSDDPAQRVPQRKGGRREGGRDGGRGGSGGARRRGGSGSRNRR
jgi:ATP-dependent RNA helicase DeaD